MAVKQSKISQELINKLVNQTLREDSFRHDVTSKFLIPKSSQAQAQIIATEAMIVCGLDFAKAVFKKVDKSLSFSTPFKDGEMIKKNRIVAKIKGKTRAILTGERTALNFLSYLSGIAAHTHDFVQRARPYKAKIYDTRKTTPSLRAAEKYAVTCGGGMNHRFSLQEMLFLKDNHRSSMKNALTKERVKRLKKKSGCPFVIEVDTSKQYLNALELNPDIILLDNMTMQQIKDCVLKLKKYPKAKKPLLEASGGITLKNIVSVAKTGVDRISVGALTQTHRGCNLSLEIL